MPIWTSIFFLFYFSLLLISFFFFFFFFFFTAHDEQWQTWAWIEHEFYYHPSHNSSPDKYWLDLSKLTDSLWFFRFCVFPMVNNCSKLLALTLVFVESIPENQNVKFDVIQIRLNPRKMTSNFLKYLLRILVCGKRNLNIEQISYE
jgi:hypothetical protein